MGGVGGVYEVAAVSEEAAAQLQEGPAALGLVLAVLLLVLFQFVQSVCEFTAILVGTASVLDEPFAELGFLLVGRLQASRGLLGGEGVRGGLGELEGGGGAGVGDAAGEHDRRLVLLLIIIAAIIEIAYKPTAQTVIVSAFGILSLPTSFRITISYSCFGL
jgi:hypothetical protein